MRKIKTCEVCKQTFVARISRQKYCGNQCQDIGVGRKNAEETSEEVSAEANKPSARNVYKSVRQAAIRFAGGDRQK
jgi:hypothetical protein